LRGRDAYCRGVHQDDRNPRLELTFDQLALIHKSLQAVRTLGVLPPRDELLDDTILLVDQALDAAVQRKWAA
jgi:hypothetical protein